ncbi:MAG: isoprenylcysteine carboxylmethyltransferase family protein [Pseudomonadota bacterium]|nr:isoprenylcysteine carboxylmethyltransferase family protein [Pseudomonadota bacterium]
MPTTSSQNLIEKNIYQLTRNPMYLGLLIFQIGLGISLKFIHITLFAVMTFVIFDFFVIRREEIYLEKKFKEEYLIYKSKVRRWL